MNVAKIGVIDVGGGLRGIYAVSYTHLDVYKRQGQHRRLIGTGRQKQNRRVRLGANAAADGKAVLTGHHHIQQDAVLSLIHILCSSF